MARAGWYMLCYDIANPKRLYKIHKIMKKNGIAAQKSVFFIQRTDADMNHLIGQMEKIIKFSEDDIRAYPVVNPDKVWTTGGVLESFPLIMPGRKKRADISAAGRAVKGGKKSLWKRIFSFSGKQEREHHG